jgi:hypothetical protein
MRADCPYIPRRCCHNRAHPVRRSDESGASNREDLLVYRYTSRTVLILGMPRSGTSWLAKIFDSHPETLYRHEPDIVHRNNSLPYRCSSEDAQAYVPEMQAWLNVLAEDRSQRTVGSRPIFAKRYHTARQTALRRAVIAGLKTAGAALPIRAWSTSVQVPDFTSLDAEAVRRIVIKSVSAMGRIELMLAAAPEMQIVLIVRHPCGQIASILRGVRWSLFDGEIPIAEPDSALVRRRGINREVLGKMSFTAQLAWNWVIRNELAIQAVRGWPRAQVVRYEDLAADPPAVSKQLFASCGLTWCNETADFLEQSTQASGREGYYQVKRNPDDAANAWRHQLHPAEIAEISGIVSESETLSRYVGPD